MPDGDASPPPRDTAVILRDLSWIIHRRAPDRAGVGPLPTTEIALLKQIVDTPGTTVGELSETLGVRQPNVSAAVRTLIERGLVERTRSASDGRVSHMSATAAGVAEHTAISAAWVARVQHAVDALPPDQRQALSDAEPAMREVLRLLRQGDADTTGA